MQLFGKKAKPLEEVFGSLLGGGRNKKISPTDTVGHSSTAIYGGYVVENEKDPSLSDIERYRTFSLILANCPIAAAGIRYFLNVAAAASWSFTAAEHPRGEELAELAEEMLTKDPQTTWARVVRRAAMYRFYGFSIQEWTAKRRVDGFLTFSDISPRAQVTIERWDVDVYGSVIGIVQRNPQNQSETYLPRSKLVYIVDDSLNDSPHGLGIFRHIVEPAKRLNRYEQLEGWGYETDLRGIPIGKAPYAELRRLVAEGVITEEQAKAAVAPIESFVSKHIKKPDLGLLLDSEVYQTTDEAQRPSSAHKFSMDLLDGTSTTLPDVAKAIERIEKQIARLLGVEAMLLGDGSSGSHALSKDKTNQFLLTVNSTLGELADGFTNDLLDVLWQLNGWPDKAKPTMTPEKVQFRDIQDITMAISDLARAGAVLDPEDPVIDEIRAMLGLSPQYVNPLADEDESLNSNTPVEGAVTSGDDLPENPGG